MRKLFVVLLLLGSLTNSNFSNSYSKDNLQNQFSKHTVVDNTTLITALRGNKYLRENFNICTNNIPTTLPVSLNGFYRISDYFGEREKHPVSGRRAFHNGIDFSGLKGTDILSSADGVVKEVKRASGYGKLVIVDHGNGIESYYAHLSKYNVRKGDKVVRGQKIAELGNTGASTGPHLHFEVRINNIPVNPTMFFDGKEITDEKELLALMVDQNYYTNDKDYFKK